jgi:ATP-dependent Clp protease adapter protein ClpS
MPRQAVLERRPELQERDTELSGDWIVVVFDNSVNTWDEVIRILQKATACSLDEAHMETWEVHHLGKSIVHHGERAECERVASIIQTIGIQVAVRKV